MELTDIMALVKAGYTKDEISQMAQTPNPVPNADPVPAPVDKPAQAEEPAPAPVAEPAPAPTPAPVPAQEAQPSMADVMQSIAKLTSAIQANAIAQSTLPNGGFQQPTAEDMVAQIIRPTYKERSN